MQVFQISDFENTLTEKKDFFFITRTETMEEDNTCINK